MLHARHRAYPAVTVDVVIVALGWGEPRVLLIKRKKAPFEGCWAIPGGFVEPNEPLEAAARRELREETGATPTHLAQLHTFGDPGRDPRGWTISVAYLALLTPEEMAGWHLRAASDASEVGWFALNDPPPLAFDHAEILACAAGHLAERETMGEAEPGQDS
jgi:8-oxo-dGTP diphosphatase